VKLGEFDVDSGHLGVGYGNAAGYWPVSSSQRTVRPVLVVVAEISEVRRISRKLRNDSDRLVETRATVAKEDVKTAVVERTCATVHRRGAVREPSGAKTLQLVQRLPQGPKGTGKDNPNFSAISVH
jgi:hypothetical protein